MSVEVGQQAPDATLVSGERKPVKISEFRGKTAVLAFFPAAFTGTCTKEMCRFRDDYTRLDSLKAQVIGISEIGRASCRERVEISECVNEFKRKKKENNV